MGDASTASSRGADLCRHLPEHTVIVVYAVAEGRLVTWLVRSSRIWLSPVQPDWTKIAALARPLREVRLEGPPESSSNASTVSSSFPGNESFATMTVPSSYHASSL
jgi:hypothetical protein